MLNLFDRFVPAVNGEQSFDVVERLMHDPQYMALHRPFKPTYGPNENVPCVVVNVRQRDGTPRYTVEKGVKTPVREQVRVVDALLSGLPVPPWALNATVFRRDDWVQLDTEVQVAYRDELKFINILQNRVSVGGFDGWGKMTYEYDAMSDAHAAVMDMDGLTDAFGDMPTFLPRSVPLPFTHSDFHYSDRVLAASRSNGGTGMDVYSGEMAGRRVAELVEDVAIGEVGGITWGTRANHFPHDLTSTWFGLKNYTNRNTKTNFTAPTTGGWVPDTLYNEILAALDTLRLDRVTGPVAIFYSGDFDQYLNRVYSLSGGNTPGETLRSMLLKHPRVEAVELLDRISTAFTLYIVALDKRYIRFINGMGPRTWQWDSKGGFQKNFKVGVIQATLLLSDITGRSGYLHGTTA